MGNSLLAGLLIFDLGTTALFSGFLLIIGFVVGVVSMRRWYERHVPLGYDPLNKAIEGLEADLKKTDVAVSQLWVTAKFSPDQRKVINVKAIDRPETDTGLKAFLKSLLGRLLRKDLKAEEIKIHPLVLRIIKIKLTLESLRRSIDEVIPWLINKPIPQGMRTIEEAVDEGRITTPTDGNKQTDTFIGSLFTDGHKQSETGLSIEPGQQRDNFEPTSAVQNKPVRGTLSAASITAKIIELYNRAVTDAFAREQFREQFNPIRIGTMNAVERTRNPTIDAEFREATDGDFFAFAIAGTTQYAVVPRLGLTIEAVSYNAGALGQVFDKTQNYDSGLYYSHYRVRQPATFKRDGDRWVLQSPGELDLGPGD